VQIVTILTTDIKKIRISKEGWNSKNIASIARSILYIRKLSRSPLSLLRRGKGEVY
jgi:nuclear transport factor 2 (NTF2) superfamily protein